MYILCNNIPVIYKNSSLVRPPTRELLTQKLKSALIEKCESEGILYATVAMDRRTKEMILPDTLQGALKHPEFFVCTCKKVKDQYVVEEITEV